MRDAVHDRECTSDSTVAISADYRRVPGRLAGERLTEACDLVVITAVQQAGFVALAVGSLVRCGPICRQRSQTRVAVSLTDGHPTRAGMELSRNSGHLG